MSDPEWHYRSDFARGLHSAGRIAGRAALLTDDQARAAILAEVVLMILRLLHIEYCASDEHRIRSCTDVDQLNKWMERAFKVREVDEILR
ncbi:hypothetical protein [Nocardia aurantia]|uniref:hypothetical protein n=1 Tax=Nocardia aurantia TaxID=2585199 RepID=UPI0012950E5A|nr:hypothetical protein [Nocardia aurantia]